MSARERKRVAAAELDGDLVVGSRRRAAAALDDAAYRLGQPVLAHGLEHVVDRVELEGVDGVPLVGGHEDDRRRLLEAGQHLGQLEPGQARHRDVEEDPVDLQLLEDPQRVGGRVAGEHLADPGVALQQEGQLVQCGTLVVDDEHPQARGGWCGHGRTPGAYLGTRTVTLVPAPGAVSTTRP